jgi:FtsH-binding integral membrane protein
MNPTQSPILQSNTYSNTKLPKTKLQKHHLLTIGWALLAVVIGIAHQKYQECHYRLPWLYVFLAYLFGTIVLSQRYIQGVNYQPYFWPIAIGGIALLIAIHFTPRGSPAKYALFLAWFICMCFIFHPIARVAQDMNILVPVIVTVVSLFVVLSVVSYLKPNLISNSIGNILFFALLGLLITRIAFIFTKPSRKMVEYSAYIGIAIFSGFIMFDTKLARQRANQCAVPFDYVENLIGLFLDVINLFSEIVLAKSSRRD